MSRCWLPRADARSLSRSPSPTPVRRRSRETGPVVPSLLIRIETNVLNGLSSAAAALASAVDPVAVAEASAAIVWLPPAESPSLSILSSTALFLAFSASARASARASCWAPSGPSISARAAAPACTDWSKPSSLPGALIRASSSVFDESDDERVGTARRPTADRSSPLIRLPAVRSCLSRVRLAAAPVSLLCSTAPRPPPVPGVNVVCLVARRCLRTPQRPLAPAGSFPLPDCPGRLHYWPRRVWYRLAVSPLFSGLIRALIDLGVVRPVRRSSRSVSPARDRRSGARARRVARSASVSLAARSRRGGRSAAAGRRSTARSRWRARSAGSVWPATPRFQKPPM